MGLRWRGMLLVAAAAAVAFAPMPPPLIERIYSAGAYLRIQRILTSLSNLVPIALFDVLLIATVACWLFALSVDLVRDRGAWMRIAVRLVGRTLAWSAGFYLAFLLTWGLNYRRVHLVDKLQFDADTVSPGGAAALATTAVNELNALHGRAHASGWFPLTTIGRPLAAAFDRSQRELGATTLAVAGRPKTTLLEPYFRRAGVAGMTDPYFLETMVERELLPFERPFVVGHEWAHLAGYADESEANFVGWLTCLRGSTGDQVQRVAVPVRRVVARRPAGRSRRAVGTTGAWATRRSESDRRSAAPPGESGCVGGWLAGLRSVSESQSRRSRCGELRGSGPAGSGHAIWLGVEADDERRGKLGMMMNEE